MIASMMSTYMGGKNTFNDFYVHYQQEEKETDLNKYLVGLFGGSDAA